MRFIACLFIVLCFATLAKSQDFFANVPSIESGARDKHEEAQAQIEVQKREIADLRSVIETLKSTRCPCCESGDCQCGKKAAKPSDCPTVGGGYYGYGDPRNVPLHDHQGVPYCTCNPTEPGCIAWPPPWKVKQLEEAGKHAAPATQPFCKITLVSMNGCSACPVAEAYHGPRYKATGWQWSTRSDGPGRPGMFYPYYEVCIGDSCTVVQCKNIYELDARINELIASRNQQPVHDKRGRFLGNW